MDLFKQMWYRKQAKLRGYAYVSGKQNDTQASFISQAPIKK